MHGKRHLRQQQRGHCQERHADAPAAAAEELHGVEAYQPFRDFP
jgi:hypothetical protein